MEIKQIKSFQQNVERELKENLLPFWTQKVLDTEHGGFIGRMSNDLRVVPDAPKGLILNARLLWTYSALYRHFHEEIYLSLATRAYEYLNQFFWDTDHGGAFWLLDAQGRVLDDKKKIYGQAFYIYALSEYALAAETPEPIIKAMDLFCLIEAGSHDDKKQGYNETCNRDWSLAEDVRLSDKDMNEKKSMNNHLHVLEAYTNLYRVTSDPQAKARLSELIRLFLDRILNSKNGHFQHFFDDDWIPKSESYTFGHDIEGSWLLWEAAEALGDANLIPKVRKTVLRLAETAVQEGMDSQYGGLFYEGRAGKVIDDNKEWWPQAEAVVGFLNAYQLSQDFTYFIAAFSCWNFIEKHTKDRQHGEWFWRVSRGGNPDLKEPKVSEWKGPYHNIRACLEAGFRLKSIG